VIINNKQGETTTPSVVSFVDAAEGGSRSVIGSPARRMAVTNPDQTIHGVKRFIGRRFEDEEVQALARTLSYQLAPAPNGDAWVRVGGIAMSPQEISALLLAELRTIAEQHFTGEVTEAIITVPAHFDNEQRKATKDAATIAGLKVRRLLNEPTAAALGFGAHRSEDKRYAVCDLGGGTFDVSIVNVEDGLIEVISTDGDLFLGGDDVDRAIIVALVDEFRAEQGIDLFDDPTALQRLNGEVRTAKHTLSEATVATMSLPYLSETEAGKRIDYKRTFMRRELETWAAPLIDRLEAPCLAALARCGLKASQVDAIILVGGMTRMPSVQAKISSIFGRPPLKVVNPDEIVSIGAATQAAILDGTVEGVVLLDVTSRAIGLSTNEQRYQQVIAKSAAVPTREHKIVSTTEDGQRELSIDVYEGEFPNPHDNRHLGRFVLGNLPDGRAGEVMLLVEFTVDVDGILRVSASDMATGRRPELRMVATAGLSRLEVSRMINSMADARKAGLV